MEVVGVCSNVVHRKQNGSPFSMREIEDFGREVAVLDLIRHRIQPFLCR